MRADKALVQRRQDDILRIRLDGAQWVDVRDFVRVKEKEPGSNWFLSEGENPMSEGMIRRYQQRADREMVRTHERSRKKAYYRHLAQRKNLYARATLAGDTRTALSILQDEAHILGLYPKTRIEHSGSVKQEHAIDLGKLTEENLQDLERILRTLSRGSTDGESPA